MSIIFGGCNGTRSDERENDEDEDEDDNDDDRPIGRRKEFNLRRSGWNVFIRKEAGLSLFQSCAKESASAPGMSSLKYPSSSFMQSKNTERKRERAVKFSISFPKLRSISFVLLKKNFNF